MGHTKLPVSAGSADFSTLDWQNSVLDKDLVTAPIVAVGSRYILAGTGGDWAAFTINDIAEFTVTGWTNITPNPGFATYVEDEDQVYFFNGTDWLAVTALIDRLVDGTGSFVYDSDGTSLAGEANVSTLTLTDPTAGATMQIVSGGAYQNDRYLIENTGSFDFALCNNWTFAPTYRFCGLQMAVSTRAQCALKAQENGGVSATVDVNCHPHPWAMMFAGEVSDSARYTLFSANQNLLGEANSRHEWKVADAGGGDVTAAVLTLDKNLIISGDRFGTNGNSLTLQATQSITLDAAQIIKRRAIAAADDATDPNDYIVSYTSIGGGGNTLTLSSADVAVGRVIIVKDESGAAGGTNITIATEGAENIDGAGASAIAANYGTIRLFSDGTNWFTF
ncbi:MAG: hypothetical protein DRI65_10430 [Chloroflexota bacterium]|nr:MAG: hypothetical protein DRI65_10430 [Chloroflexota bacterium]